MCERANDFCLAYRMVNFDNNFNKSKGGGASAWTRKRFELFCKRVLKYFENCNCPILNTHREVLCMSEAKVQIKK